MRICVYTGLHLTWTATTAGESHRSRCFLSTLDLTARGVFHVLKVLYLYDLYRALKPVRMALRNSCAAFRSGVQVLPDDRCSTSVRLSRWRGEACKLRTSDRLKLAARATSCNGDVVFDSAPVERASFLLHPLSFSESCLDRKTLDRWVQDYVFEIVKSIREAPFLQYIFDSKDGNANRRQRRRVSSTALEQDPSECWSYVRDSVMNASPDGLIFVRKLDKETSDIVRDAQFLSATTSQCPMKDGLCLRNRSTESKDDGDTSSVDVWGVLVQGRGDIGSSCYILETTRATVCGGTSCTRFCLTRAQCFGPSLQAQIALMWLQK